MRRLADEHERRLADAIEERVDVAAVDGAERVGGLCDQLRQADASADRGRRGARGGRGGRAGGGAGGGGGPGARRHPDICGGPEVRCRTGGSGRLRAWWRPIRPAGVPDQRHEHHRPEILGPDLAVALSGQPQQFLLA